MCQEDRAISCRDGDVAIHSATAVTKKHCRFLLTVVRVSAVPIPSSPAVEAEAVDSLHGSIIKDSSSMYGHHGGGDEQHLVVADQDAAGVAFCPTRFRLGFLRPRIGSQAVRRLPASSRNRRPRISVRCPSVVRATEQSQRLHSPDFFQKIRIMKKITDDDMIHSRSEGHYFLAFGVPQASALHLISEEEELFVMLLRLSSTSAQIVVLPSFFFSPLLFLHNEYHNILKFGYYCIHLETFN